jgi:hypothetical protein
MVARFWALAGGFLATFLIGVWVGAAASPQPAPIQVSVPVPASPAEIIETPAKTTDWKGVAVLLSQRLDRANDKIIRAEEATLRMVDWSNTHHAMQTLRKEIAAMQEKRTSDTDDFYRILAVDAAQAPGKFPSNDSSSAPAWNPCFLATPNTTRHTPRFRAKGSGWRLEWEIYGIGSHRGEILVTRAGAILERIDADGPDGRGARDYDGPGVFSVSVLPIGPEARAFFRVRGRDAGADPEAVD